MMRNFIIIMTAAFFSVINAQQWTEQLKSDKKNDFYKVQKAFNDYWEGKEYKKGQGWKQFKRWEYFWDQRLWPSGKFPNASEKFQEMKNYNKKHDPSIQQSQPEWRLQGPVDAPENQLAYDSRGLGRLNCIEFHPVDQYEIWVGSASGGAWYTTNKGKTWNVIQLSGIMSLGVSDIAISKSNPNVIYIATGDQNGSWMTRGYSIGIIKSTNGGIPWEQTGLSREIQNGFLIGRILVHPLNPDHVIAGTGNGIYLSEDGGETWTRTVQNDFYRDMEMHPKNPDIIYAAGSANFGSKIMKSTDAGKTFKQTNSISLSNRIELAVTTAAPENVYALCSSRATNGFYAFYLSENEGESWQRQSTSPNILGIHPYGNSDGGQGSYDLALAVSPEDPGLIYTGGIHIWKSNNAGKNWSLVNHWTGGYNKPFVHADQHWLEFDERTGDLYSANDGGIYRTVDNGNVWIDMSNGLPIAQFYRLSTIDHYDTVIMGGTQDCGTHYYKDGKWLHVHGGDGMECAIDPKSQNILYASNYNGNLQKSVNGGKSFAPVFSPSSIGEYSAWITPFVVHPVLEEHIFVGSENLYLVNTKQSTAQRLTSFSQRDIINTIAISENNPDVIYFGRRNILYKTKNGGQSWDAVFTASNVITDIDISDNNDDKAWVTLSGYNDGKKVYRIVNDNAYNMSDDLPNFPVNTVVEQNNSPGTLFVGTDIGVFKYSTIKNKWEPFQNGLPPVVINELEINYSIGRLYAATFGRGIWYSQIIDCGMDQPVIQVDGDTHFCEGDTTVLKLQNTDYHDFFWSNGSTEKSLEVTKTGVYFAVAVNEEGCTKSSEKIEITVNNVPDLLINGNSAGDTIKLCENDSLSLNASFGFKYYLWSTNDTTRSIKIAEPGVYSIVTRTNEGCISRLDPVIVQQIESPDKPEIHQYGDSLYTTESYNAYRWYLNGDIIQSSNKQRIKAEEDGEYLLEVFNESWCSTYSDTVSIITSVNGQINYSLNNIKVQPNPSSGIFKIITGSDIQGNLEITDITGNILLEFEDIEINGKTIDISQFANGVFFFRVYSGGAVAVRKIIKR